MPILQCWGRGLIRIGELKENHDNSYSIVEAETLVPGIVFKSGLTNTKETQLV